MGWIKSFLILLIGFVLVVREVVTLTVVYSRLIRIINFDAKRYGHCFNKSILFPGDESINALVMTNPASAIAYGGTSHAFTCTLSESTIGSEYHEIKWFYQGPTDSTSAVSIKYGLK